ncbi:MAG: hypothetical protein RLY16_2420 [Bacteroidota bacterium]
MHIRLVPYRQIDFEKWDACISNAPNGLIYGYSWYLDAMCEHWEGLVYGDYVAVMPLCYRKKYGFSYLYQPFLTASLGLFGQEITETLLQVFLDHIPAHYKYWDMDLNFGNQFSLNKYPMRQRMNFVLDLAAPYEQIQQGYRNNITRNVKKLNRYGATIHRDISVQAVFELAGAQSIAYGGIDANAYIKFEQLFFALHQQGKAIAYGVKDARNQWVATAAFVFDQRRAYYILVGNHPDGKTIGASHALIDQFIRDHAASGLILDFEGSDIASLAFFYSSFGAVPQPYPALKLNRLPFWMKWLKR